ncbi:MAG: ABC transporter substrate-binding protein, partial [Rhodospirillaceae bacterium]|nr:ABC transporter substrate-binding protein [Rhodospirillaceae bacterium]
MIARLVLVTMGLCAAAGLDAQTQSVTVGSKTFTESYLLAEMLAQLRESRSGRVERRTGLGGTLVAVQALVSGEIDVYPEYSG